MIKCPKLPEDGQLVNVTLETENGKVYHYKDLEDFSRCQLHGHPVSAVLDQPTELVLPNTKAMHANGTAELLPYVVMSTMIRGASPQAYLPQWIEYHRRVFGIAHFFVYINEPWQTFRQRHSYQDWDFVTYIPYPLGYYNDEDFYFQRIQQNDMFWRLKLARLSLPSDKFGSQIQWVGMMDIDEYLDVPALDSSAIYQWQTANSVYRKHLGNLLGKYSNADSDVIALSFQNTFYSGEGAMQFKWINANETALDILLCRFGNHRPPLYSDHKNWLRQKFFACIDTAVFMNVHIVHGTSDVASWKTARILWLDPETELRHNHFKLNFGKAAKRTDLKFRDTFCPMMREVLDWA